MLKTLLITVALFVGGMASAQNHKAPAPMYRDPITDGAADPVVFWNHKEQCWWMFYTQRRANSETADVAYCYGNPIGVAQSDDNGASWYYRGTLDLDFEPGHNTFWAPEVVYDRGTYHLFVAYIKGVRNHWGGEAHVMHYTSKDLWNWKLKGPLQLGSDKVIDLCVMARPDGGWRAWYKDETDGSSTYMSDSKDLNHWSIGVPAIPGVACEGQKVFRFKDYYWMLTDEWRGLRLYRSTDLETWEKQGLILSGPSDRPDDRPRGGHCDVVVTGEQAYVIYFTHPGRVDDREKMDDNGNLPYVHRRSSIQCAELLFKDGTLDCDRSDDFDFYLPDQGK